jgi:hypothetical protein
VVMWAQMNVLLNMSASLVCRKVGRCCRCCSVLRYASCSSKDLKPYFSMLPSAPKTWNRHSVCFLQLLRLKTVLQYASCSS